MSKLFGGDGKRIFLRDANTTHVLKDVGKACQCMDMCDKDIMSAWLIFIASYSKIFVFLY